MSKIRKLSVIFTLAVVAVTCFSFPAFAGKKSVGAVLDSNEDTILTYSEGALEYLDSMGYTYDEDADVIYNSRGNIISPNSSRGFEATASDGITENGKKTSEIMSDLEFDISSDIQPLETEAKISSTSYTTKWISGHHDWQYDYYWLYCKAKFHAWTKTSWGTATTPGLQNLYADKIWFEAHVKPLSPWGHLGDFSKTAYNTYFVEGTNKASFYGSGGHPTGMQVIHKATYNGVTWYTWTKSGSCS